MEKCLVSYEIDNTNKNHIIYPTTLWNYIDDGIMVVYDKNDKCYTDDCQTDYEIGCLGYDFNENPKVLDYVKQIAGHRNQHVHMINNTFEIVSDKNKNPNDKSQIFLNAITQLVVIEFFRTKPKLGT